MTDRLIVVEKREDDLWNASFSENPSESAEGRTATHALALLTESVDDVPNYRLESLDGSEDKGRIEFVLIPAEMPCSAI